MVCFYLTVFLSLSHTLYLSLSLWARFPTELGGPTMMNNGCNFPSTLRSFEKKKLKLKLMGML
jgi:hypothetical protein